MTDQVKQNSANQTSNQTDDMENTNESVEIVLDGVTPNTDSDRISEEMVYHMDTSEMAGTDGQHTHSIYSDKQAKQAGNADFATGETDGNTDKDETDTMEKLEVTIQPVDVVDEQNKTSDEQIIAYLTEEQDKQGKQSLLQKWQAVPAYKKGLSILTLSVCAGLTVLALSNGKQNKNGNESQTSTVASTPSTQQSSQQVKSTPTEENWCPDLSQIGSCIVPTPEQLQDGKVAERMKLLEINGKPTYDGIVRYMDMSSFLARQQAKYGDSLYHLFPRQLGNLYRYMANHRQPTVDDALYILELHQRILAAADVNIVVRQDDNTVNRETESQSAGNTQTNNDAAINNKAPSAPQSGIINYGRATPSTSNTQQSVQQNRTLSNTGILSNNETVIPPRTASRGNFNENARALEDAILNMDGGSSNRAVPVTPSVTYYPQGLPPSRQPQQNYAAPMQNDRVEYGGMNFKGSRGTNMGNENKQNERTTQNNRTTKQENMEIPEHEEPKQRSWLGRIFRGRSEAE